MAASMPFATTADYEDRYGPCTNRERLVEALMDATRLIEAECRSAGVDVRDPGLSDALMQVCRSAAARSMQACETGAPLGVTQFSQGAAGFTESWSMANPSADVYLTKADRAMLGISGQAFASVQAGCPW